MSDRLTAALLAYDSAAAELEALNEQVQAADSFGAVANLAVELEAVKARVRVAKAQLERQQALRAAHKTIGSCRTRLQACRKARGNCRTTAALP